MPNHFFSQNGLSACCTDTSITLFWDKPAAAGAAETYTVLLDDAVAAHTEKTHCTLEALRPETAYSLFVQWRSGSIGELTVRTTPTKHRLNVTAAPYFAVGDGETMNTAALQKAIDDCGEQEAVYLPAGIYRTGALRLHSNMEIFLEEGAVLQGTAIPEDYLPRIPSRFEGIEMECYSSLLNLGTLDHTAGPNCENVILRGKGTIASGGKLLAERGVLRKGAFFECAARSLCGQYLGQTAPRTAEICREAYGSVLFIDEAYSLYRGERDGDAYGREAIDTLIAEMENHRDDFVVIMAGYPGEMETLLAANPGLESRMPYVIEFPDYDRAALAEIFLRFCRGKVAVAADFAAAVHAYFDTLPDAVLESESFSNARFVRNLFERTCGKAAMRARLAGADAVVLKKEDFRAAGSDREFAAMMEKKPKRMGFGV